LVKKLARFGSSNKHLKKKEALWAFLFIVYGFAALHSLISTRAGALPKICRQTTRTGELCVVKLGDACIAVAKFAIRFSPQRI
jgi:hypothetical protein